MEVWALVYSTSSVTYVSSYLATSHVLIRPWTTAECSDRMWCPWKGTGTADQAKIGCAQWNLMSLHFTLVWHLCLSSSTKSAGMEVASWNGNVHWTSHMMIMYSIASIDCRRCEQQKCCRRECWPYLKMAQNFSKSRVAHATMGNMGLPCPLTPAQRYSKILWQDVDKKVSDWPWHILSMFHRSEPGHPVSQHDGLSLLLQHVLICVYTLFR